MQMNKSIGNNKFDNKRYCEGKQGEKNRFMMTISYETRTLREALGVPLRFSDVFSSMYILGQQWDLFLLNIFTLSTRVADIIFVQYIQSMYM